VATARKCPQCDAQLHDLAANGACPACLLLLGLNSSEFSLVNGEHVGPFLILRPLGRGGMGEVYEAEEIESGRRIALKILAERANTPAYRERFLREGRLAASIRDDHTVYVFGTHESNGVLAIAMELVDGGTLRDLVIANKPLSLNAAVDAILQVIAGLEAAAAVGILHRDVKPSNCFVDRNGTVKVGDFGLSISAAERDATQTAATVLGTPEFASPEQIRGDAVDVRSDIYSTAGTLYYLLTGRPPFSGKSVVEVISRVLENNVDSLASHRPDVPGPVVRCVMRCLSRDPADRPPTYEQLRRQLIAFSSAALPTVGPVPRLSAAAIDGIVLAAPMEALELWFPHSGWLAHSPSRLGISLVLGVVYFGVVEGIWGASIGKAICGLRIVRMMGHPAGTVRALIRAAVYHAADVPMLGFMVLAPVITSTRTAANIGVLLAAQCLLILVLFSTARRGRFVGLHDLASGTHVVRRRQAFRREPVPVPAPREVTPADRVRVGPYSILATLTNEPTAALLFGHDPILERRVWIRTGTALALAVSAERRDLHRPGRLRWLCGRHVAQESWDAFEAPDGVPFTRLGRDCRPWSSVRFWLVDLAEELHACMSSRSGDLVLDEERIWITKDGRAMMLDFAAPDGRGHGSPARATLVQELTSESAQHFLRRVARSALAGHPPLPLGARSVLTRLGHPSLPDFAEVVAALRAHLHTPARVTARRRMVHLGLSAALPIAAIVAAIGSAIVDRTLTSDRIIAPIGASLFLMAGIGMWSAALFRGGLVLHAMGIAIALPNGEEASRQRAMIRGMLAWAPCILVQVAIGLGSVWIGVATMIVWAAAAVVMAWTVERGVQDWAMGTYLVPK
jgi:uncharacterized RDD family membrane protein YckC